MASESLLSLKTAAPKACHRCAWAPRPTNISLGKKPIPRSHPMSRRDRRPRDRLLDVGPEVLCGSNFGGALVTGPAQRAHHQRRLERHGVPDRTATLVAADLTAARTDGARKLTRNGIMDYDFQKGRVNGSTVLVNYRVGSFTFGGGDAYIQVSARAHRRQRDATRFQPVPGTGWLWPPSKPGLTGPPASASTRM